MATENMIEAKTRTATGTTAARRLRRAGRLPGAISEKGKPAVWIDLSRHDLDMLFRHHAGENLLLDMVLDGAETRKVLLKEAQHDPISEDIVHADFVTVSMTEKMRFRVMVQLTGDPVGVTQGGGILEQHLREVEIECLPGDLVEKLMVDVSGLALNQSLRVKGLALDSKLTMVTTGDIAVASVSEPNVEEEAAAEPEAGAAEPEVIGEKKGEAEEGEEAEEKKAKGKGEEKKGKGEEKKGEASSK